MILDLRNPLGYNIRNRREEFIIKSSIKSQFFKWNFGLTLAEALKKTFTFYSCLNTRNIELYLLNSLATVLQKLLSVISKRFGIEIIHPFNG